MPHRMDSESQAYRRRQKQNREESKKKNYHTREKQRVETQNFISAKGNSDIPRLPVIKEVSTNESSGSKHGSVIKSGNKPDLKLPPIDNGSVKQKLKQNTSLKKAEKCVLDPNRVTSGLGVQQDFVRKSNKTASENRKPSPRRSSGLNLGLNCRGLEKKTKIGSVPAQAHSSLSLSSTLASQGATDSSGAKSSSGSSLLPRRKALLRSREKNFSSHYIVLEEPTKEVEETEDPNQLKKSPSLSNSQFPSILGHGNKLKEIYLEQGKRRGLEDGNDKNASGRGRKSYHRVLREPRGVVTTAELQQRGSRARDKLCPGLEDADYSKLEYISGYDSIPKILNTINYRGRARTYTYCKEWYSSKSHQKSPGSCDTSSLPDVPGPQLHWAPRSSAAQRPNSSANWSSPTYSPQNLDLDHSPALSMNTTSSLRSFMDSSSDSESSDSSGSGHSTSEDSSSEDSTISSSSGSFYIMENLWGSSESSSLDSSSSSSSETEFTPGLHVSYVLQDHLPLDSLVLPLFQTQRIHQLNNAARNPTISLSASKEKRKKPQKKPKRHVSFLVEDSEEEGDHCRICQIAGNSPTNPLLEPCGCVGSLQFICQQCLKKWIQAKIKSGADLEAVRSCELCKQKLTPEVTNFIMSAHSRPHQQLWMGE